MEKKNLDWANLSFSYMKTDKRFVSNYKNGAWDDGLVVVVAAGNHGPGPMTVTTPGSDASWRSRRAWIYS